MMWNGMWGMWWFWLLGIILLVAITLLAVVLVRTLGRGNDPSSSNRLGAGQTPGSRQARTILDERYARGELTTEEYRERLQALDEAK